MTRTLAAAVFVVLAIVFVVRQCQPGEVSAFDPSRQVQEIDSYLDQFARGAHE